MELRWARRAQLRSAAGGEPTFAETMANGDIAPIAAARGAVLELRCYGLRGPLWPRTGLSSCGRSGQAHQTMGVPTAGSRQLVEQPLGVFQVGGVEAFGEPAVERR